MLRLSALVAAVIRISGWLLAIGLGGLACNYSSASELSVLIVRDDSTLAKDVANLLAAELKRSGWTTRIVDAGDISQSDLSLSGTRTLVVLGTSALASIAKHPENHPVIAALVPLAALDKVGRSLEDRYSAIVLDQPLDRWVGLLQLAFPRTTHVGLLASDMSSFDHEALGKKMTEKKMQLVVERVASSDGVVAAIEKLLPDISVLLALPDRVVHNRNTVQPLLLTTYRAGIPVVAYSESYQQAGAVIALYSTVPQIVSHVIETIELQNSGRAIPKVQPPKYFTVGINQSVARSLGLSLLPASELGARLKGSTRQ